MAKNKLRILLADDHLIVRMGLAALIDRQPDMSVVGEATDGAEAIASAGRLRPDVTVMDIRMPGTDGAEATAEIIRQNPSAKILILTTFSSAPEVRRALAAGAAGALSKDAQRAELLDAIRRVAQGERIIDREIQSVLDAATGEPNLSTRQREVLGLVAKGFGNREIARLLGLSVDGVKKHLKTIFAALGVSSRTEAVSFALNQNLI